VIPGVYANSDKKSAPWFAPAGINRGGLSTVLRTQFKLTQADKDELYENNVNPLATLPRQGVVVFGQKTLQKQQSALDRINVRRLVIELKGYLRQVSEQIVFEQNTTSTRTSFIGKVTPYLETIQQKQGLYAFKVVMDDANNGPDVIDRNQLIGQIYIQPTKTAEFISLDFILLPTGAQFP
jgi:phage tail sheath protein FI